MTLKTPGVRTDRRGSRLARSLRFLAPRIVLTLISAALPFLALEGFYRLVKLKKLGAECFIAYKDSLYEYDPTFGYAYVAGASTPIVQVADGKVVGSWRAVTNALGNIGDPAISSRWDESEFRVLVVGDSFTANPNYGGVSWPDHFFAASRGLTGRDIAVLNRGRDGYGVLQMLTMAAAEGRSRRCNMIILAFISNDLKRARFWRRTYRDSRDTRILVAGNPQLDPATRVDAFLVNRDVKQLRINDDASFLVQQHRRLLSFIRRLRMAALRDPWHSFLVNRIVFGDAYGRVRWPCSPMHEYSDFHSDRIFASDADALNALGVPIALVHIPVRKEIVTRRYQLDPCERSLLASLRAALPRATFIELLEFIAPPGQGISKAFMLPYDNHPSHLGARMYGEAIARALIARGLIGPSLSGGGTPPARR